jgi:hypothetical protein
VRRAGLAGKFHGEATPRFELAEVLLQDDFSDAARWLTEQRPGRRRRSLAATAKQWKAQGVSPARFWLLPSGSA